MADKSALEQLSGSTSPVWLDELTRPVAAAAMVALVVGLDHDSHSETSAATAIEQDIVSDDIDVESIAANLLARLQYPDRAAELTQMGGEQAIAVTPTVDDDALVSAPTGAADDGYLYRLTEQEAEVLYLALSVYCRALHRQHLDVPVTASDGNAVDVSSMSEANYSMSVAESTLRAFDGLEQRLSMTLLNWADSRIRLSGGRGMAPAD